LNEELTGSIVREMEKFILSRWLILVRFTAV